jgi:hypothetical protein
VEGRTDDNGKFGYGLDTALTDVSSKLSPFTNQPTGPNSPTEIGQRKRDDDLMSPVCEVLRLVSGSSDQPSEEISHARPRR